MTCELTNSYDGRNCGGGKGGLRSIMFIELKDIELLTAAACNVTVLDLVATKTPKHYKLRPNLSNYTAPGKRDPDSGNTSYPIALQMVLNDDTKELRCEINALLKSTVVAVAEKADGTIVLLGEREGLVMGDGNEHGSGTVKSDRNGHVLGFVGEENEPVPDVDPAIWTALVAAAPAA